MRNWLLFDFFSLLLSSYQIPPHKRTVAPAVVLFQSNPIALMTKVIIFIAAHPLVSPHIKPELGNATKKKTLAI